MDCNGEERAGTQRMGEGGLSEKTTEWERVEDIGRGLHNADHVTEYSFRAGRGFAGGDLSAAARKCQVDNPSGDEADR